MKYSFLICLILISLAGFGQRKKQVMFPPPVLPMRYPDFVDACELPNHKKEAVYTRFIYSGNEEYWGLRPEKRCNAINAYLDFTNDLTISSEYLKLMSKVHREYWKSSLIMDVVGVFEDDNKSGYGHLGSNNSKFTVSYIANMQIIGKKQ